ncbi:hypothetical protein GQ457_08G017960 [Hibiscus cannabinus]
MVQNIMYVVGDGKRIQFWSDLWIGEYPLKLSFPRVFALACQKSGTIADFGLVVEGVWAWNIPLRRSLFDWEIGLWELFQNLINNFRSNNLIPDSIRWKGNSNGIFSVKSCCKISKPVVSTVDEVWNAIWSNLAPPTVEAFLWKAVHGRLPTKDNLRIRGCLQHLSLLCSNLDYLAKMVQDLECNSNFSKIHLNDIVFRGSHVVCEFDFAVEVACGVFYPRFLYNILWCTLFPPI